MRVRATDIKNADRLLVCDGSPDTTYTYERVNGEWFEDGDTNEEPNTDREMIRCSDILKAWKGGALLLDVEAEFTKWYESEE